MLEVALRIGDCAQKGDIYQIQCLGCNELYIGETGRVLSVRVKEHLAGKRRHLQKHRLVSTGWNTIVEMSLT